MGLATIDVKTTTKKVSIDPSLTLQMMHSDVANADGLVTPQASSKHQYITLR
jgi:hypothetical protein